MLIRYSLLLLGFFVGCNSHEICNFESHLCKWSNLYPCHFTLETEKSLYGERGYLYLSKNTCKRAAIQFAVQRYMHRFQLHYFINGTGHAKLVVYASYFFGGRYLLWSCHLNQGLRWNKEDIFVYDDSLFDSISYIEIEAIIKGDVTIAIGNISPAYSGNPHRKCPKASGPIIRTPTTIKRTHKPPTTRTTPILQKTTSSTNISTTVETYDTIAVSAKALTKAPNTNSPKTITTQSSANTSTATERTVSATKSPASTVQPSRKDDQKDTTNVDVTTRSEGQQKSTYGQDVNTLQTTDAANPGSFERLESSKSKHKGLVIGSSVFGVIAVIVLSGVAILFYTRRRKLWDVRKSNGEVSAFSNPLYS